jgi:hypothetical protein
MYSNAFFEHLLWGQRIPHLSAARRSLRKEGGFLCYTGIPYFRNIAKFYLRRERGMHNEPLFDLYTVNRYTHGVMEKDGWYYEQMHKSLFDEDELGCLLDNAGFEGYIIFQYAHPDDTNSLPVNIGFFATRNPKPIEDLQKECIAFLTALPRYVSINSVCFLEPSEQRRYYRV